MKHFMKFFTLFLSLAMAVPANAAAVLAETTSSVSEPFSTSVSTNYRIPGLINYNGTLIACADARYDYEYDGGGMDIVVSKLGTSGWTQSYAAYIGDNGDVWNKNSTTMMDPAIATDGSTIYLAYDLFPAGYSISSSSTASTFSETATGFDSNNHILLKKSGESGYNYYLSDGKIYSTNGTEQSGYTVDRNMNLSSDGTAAGNLLYADCVFQTYKVPFLAVIKSTDGGNTWSSPSFINAKGSSTYNVFGPGNGLVTSDGTIMFTSYNGSAVMLLYSKDNGSTWSSVSTSAANNESSIVELNDGTIRMFVKTSGTNTIQYIDFTKSGSSYTAGSLKNTGTANFSNCMISSLHYSRTIDNKEAVLVCCPSKSSGGTWAGRFNGKIYVFTLDGSDNMTLAYSYQVNSSFFAYSAMAELSDGSIGLLYEDDCISYAAGSYYGSKSHITYTNLPMSTIASGATIGETADAEVTKTDTATGITVTSKGLTGLTVTKKDTASYSETGKKVIGYDVTPYGYTEGITATVTVPVPSGWNTNDITVYDVKNSKTITSSVTNGTITFTTTHFSEYDLVTTDDSSSEVTVPDDAKEATIDLYVGQSKTVTDDTGAYASSYTTAGLDTGIATVTAKNVTAAAGIETAAVTSIQSDQTYIIENNRSKTMLNNTTANSTMLTLSGAVSSTDGTGSEIWTISSTTGGYYVKDASGNYLTVGNGTAAVTSTPTVVQLTYTGSVWTISQQTTSYSSTAVSYSSGSNYSAYTSGSYYYLVNGDYKLITGISCTRSGRWSYSYSWTISYSGGSATASGSSITVYSSSSNTTYYLNDYGNGMGRAAGYTTGSSDAGSCWNIYSVKETTATTSTDITFTGVSEGTTHVLIGNTYYTINVSKIDTDYVLGKGIVGTTSYTGDNETSATTDMTNVEIKKLTISAGATFPLGLDSTVDVPDGWTVTWSIADSSIATVSSDGQVTGVSAGDTEVTVTVTNPGTGESSSDTIPVHVTASFGTSSSTTTVFYYIQEVTNTTPYYTLYSTNVTEELQEAQEGEVIYFVRPVTVPFSMIWVASPDEGYALTVMSASYSLGQYYPLHSGDHTLNTGSTYYAGSTAHSNLYNAYGAVQTTVDAMLTKALADPYNCDGAMSMGRRSNDGSPRLGYSLIFRSEKLPSITKEVDGIYRSSTSAFEEYYEGMTAKAGDKVYFKVTVTQYAGQDAITYTNPLVTDQLSGASFVTVNDDKTSVTSLNTTTQTPSFSNTALQEDQTYSYIVEYTIKDSDLETEIENTVDLTYTYKSAYSTASASASADAKAKITATVFESSDYVVDYGLPLTISLKGWGTKDITSITASFADVTITGNHTNGYNVTYTPKTMLTGKDVVKMTNSAGTVYTFNVIPANTVYYEDEFASITYSNSTNVTWSTSGEAQTSYQADGTVGKDAPYGYDAAYTDDTGYSNGSAHTVTVAQGSTSPTAEFTFTGTGFDLYGETNTSQGLVNVKVYDSKNNVVRTVSVQNTGTTELKQIPVVSVKDMTYGTYRVVVTPRAAYHTDDEKYAALNRGGDFTLDAVLVYQPASETDTTVASAYKTDKEQYSVFKELRTAIISTGDYDAVDGGEGVVYTYTDQTAESTSASSTEATVADYTTAGPNNEVYLQSGSTLAFILETSKKPETVQIGAKSPYGENVELEIKAVNPDDETAKVEINEFSSATAQNYVFDLYSDGSGCVTGDDTNGYRTYLYVTNNGDDILSVTNIKATFSEKSTVSFGYNAELLSLVYKEATAADPVIKSAELTGRASLLLGTTITVTTDKALPEGYTFIAECGGKQYTTTARSTSLYKLTVSGGKENTDGTYTYTLKFRPNQIGKKDITIYLVDGDNNYTDKETIEVTVKLL